MVLRGVYGELAGNERAIFWHLPIFEGSGAIWAALRPGWSLADPTSVTGAGDASTGPDAGDTLDGSLMVRSGDIVAVIGSLAWPNVQALVGTLDGWAETTGSFHARTMSLPSFQETALEIEAKAKSVFDEELLQTSGSAVTGRARLALAVLLATPASRPKERFYRVAAANHVLRNGDRYVRAVRLASSEFGEAFGDLDHQVQAWIRTVCEARPDLEMGVRLPSPIVREMASRGIETQTANQPLGRPKLVVVRE